MEAIRNYFNPDHTNDEVAEVDDPIDSAECGDNYFINNELIDIQQYYDDNDVYFTNDALYDSFKKKDINKLQFLERDKRFRETLNSDSYRIGLPMPLMFIDVSLEEGDMELFKYFLNDCKLQPSLYAKQMANINGHKSLITYMEVMGTVLRNSVNIMQVHYNAKTRVWADCIPEEYRV